jgi:hypothetical protein
MGTTPTYSWPYPESTDPVANGAQDIEDLALAVETTVSGITGGKILQVVRATDTSNRSTTSTSFTTANISVSITPSSATSDVIVIWSFRNQNGSGSAKRGQFQIYDGSAALVCAEEAYVGLETADNNYNHVTIIGYSSPATTSSVTYTGRFKVLTASVTTSIINASSTGTLWALEVAP